MLESQYFVNDTFFSDGPFPLDVTKDFLLWPDKKETTLGRQNFLGFARPCYIPLSLLAAHIQNVKYASVHEDDRVGFFDIETEKDTTFKCGRINDKEYNDGFSLLEDLARYKFIVGFNIFNFDLAVMERQLKPSSDFWRGYNISNFIVKVPRHTVAIDIMKLMMHNNTVRAKGEYDQNGIADLFDWVEPHLTVDDPPAEKCSQDVRKVKHVWDRAGLANVFNVLNDLSGCDSAVWQNQWGNQFRKSIIFNSYLEKGLLPVRYPVVPKARIIGGFKELKKKGMCKNVTYYDIESAYPTSALHEGLSFYDGDTVFPEVMKKLLDLAADPQLKPFVKNIANTLIGDQADERNFFRNPLIRVKAIDAVNKVCEDLYDTKGVRMVNTDCAMFTGKKLGFEHDYFKLRVKDEFEWVYFWTMDKWLGKSKNGVIEARGFRTIKKNPEILREARQQLLTKLTRLPAEGALKALKSPSRQVKVAFDDTSKLKFVIKKDTTDCPADKVDFLTVWESLPFGFSDLYLRGRLEYTPDQEKAEKRAYKELVSEVLNEYAI